VQKLLLTREKKRKEKEKEKEKTEKRERNREGGEKRNKRTNSGGTYCLFLRCQFLLYVA